MATIEERRAQRDAKLDELHDKLIGAVEHLVTGEDWKRSIAFAANFRGRSFNNTLLIWMQHQTAYGMGLVPEPVPSYVAGYKQWQDLGRQVQKGQPGYQIIAPVTGRFASATPGDPDSWRRLNKFEKPRPGEIVRSKVIGVRPAYVWDASQTEGEPLPELPTPRLLTGEAPTGLWNGHKAQIEAAGFLLSDAPDTTAIYGANGVTDYSEKTVRVRADMDDAARVKTLAQTRDPELFARRVATALFTWDTEIGLYPLDYTSAILAVGDPSGTEQAGLAADIATYLPTRDAWIELRRYATSQRLDIDGVSIPSAWADAVAQARPDQLPPGAVAYTINGARRRDGVWNESPESMTAPVAFTLFIACPPDGAACYLLRLSQLNNPLR